MPNWSMNRLYFKNEKELKKFKEKTFTDGHFDFNRIIPMPEHQPDFR